MALSPLYTHTYANRSFIQVDVDISYVSIASKRVRAEHRRLSNVTTYDVNGHYGQYE